MTNTCSNVQHTKVLPLSLTDHDSVMCVRTINHRKTINRSEQLHAEIIPNTIIQY